MKISATENVSEDGHLWTDERSNGQVTTAEKTSGIGVWIAVEMDSEEQSESSSEQYEMADDSICLRLRIAPRHENGASGNGQSQIFFLGQFRRSPRDLWPHLGPLRFPPSMTIRRSVVIFCYFFVAMTTEEVKRKPKKKNRRRDIEKENERPQSN